VQEETYEGCRKKRAVIYLKRGIEVQEGPVLKSP